MQQFKVDSALKLDETWIYMDSTVLRLLDTNKQTDKQSIDRYIDILFYCKALNSFSTLQFWLNISVIKKLLKISHNF